MKLPRLSRRARGGYPRRERHRELEIVVGSDVQRDTFFAELTADGVEWAIVFERNGEYFIELEDFGGARVVLDYDVAMNWLQEGRRRIQLDDGAQV